MNLIIFSYGAHHFYLRSDESPHYTWDVYGWLESLNGNWEWVLMTREHEDPIHQFIFQWLGLADELMFVRDYMFVLGNGQVWWEFQHHPGKFKTVTQNRGNGIQWSLT